MVPEPTRLARGPSRPLGDGLRADGVRLPPFLELGPSEPLGSVPAASGTSAPILGGGGPATPPQWPAWGLAHLSEQAQ